MAPQQFIAKMREEEILRRLLALNLARDQEVTLSGVVVLESVLTCPHCGYAKLETMPTDACQWFYECSKCHALLRPKSGDCCVFCSYGSVPCPPVQVHGKAGGCCCVP